MLTGVWEEIGETLQYSLPRSDFAPKTLAPPLVIKVVKLRIKEAMIAKQSGVFFTLGLITPSTYQPLPLRSPYTKHTQLMQYVHFVVHPEYFLPHGFPNPYLQF